MLLGVQADDWRRRNIHKRDRKFGAQIPLPAAVKIPSAVVMSGFTAYDSRETADVMGASIVALLYYVETADHYHSGFGDENFRP